MPEEGAGKNAKGAGKIRKTEIKIRAEIKNKKPAVPKAAKIGSAGEENVHRIFYSGKEIILVGTAHISARSIAIVRETIEREMPDTVAVELDAQRYAQLKSGAQWGETNIGEIIKSGQTYLFLINLLLANLQRQMGQKVGIKPGEEMLEAVNIAEGRGIGIALVDRNVRVTLKRAMNAMGLREKLNLLISIFAGFFGNAKDELTADKIEELKKKDMMSELMQQLSREMPNVKHVLVDERDMYIANKILAAPGQKVVAVVGAGHIGGIMHYLDKPRGVQHLELLPAKKGGAMKYMKYLVPVIFFSIIAYALLTKGAAASLDMFILWFLINGTLSALGVLLARGHPFTIIAAFLAAPFTSLHPMIAAGWIAGAVEAKVRNPKVKDFEGLRNLNSYRDFSRNQVTRILLVVAYANLGSTLGTLIALPYIVSLLA